MTERTRVIIADDESIIRMDLREMLTNLGYLVVGEVGDGRSAVNLARELRNPRLSSWTSSSRERSLTASMPPAS
jgi:AmiR/NasT family two-component response regulator